MGDGFDSLEIKRQCRFGGRGEHGKRQKELIHTGENTKEEEITDTKEWSEKKKSEVRDGNGKRRGK